MNLRKAKSAISDYRKATRDTLDTLELLKLVYATSGMGWGYADDVQSIVSEVEEKHEEDQTP